MRRTVSHQPTLLWRHRPVAWPVVFRWRYAGPWRASRGRMAAPAAS